jgi:hypothetical protein
MEAGIMAGEGDGFRRNRESGAKTIIRRQIGRTITRTGWIYLHVDRPDGSVCANPIG